MISFSKKLYAETFSIQKRKGKEHKEDKVTVFWIVDPTIACGYCFTAECCKQSDSRAATQTEGSKDLSCQIVWIKNQPKI